MAAPSDAARSFVEIAADSHFPIQNLPYGIFKTPGDARPRAASPRRLRLDLRAGGRPACSRARRARGCSSRRSHVHRARRRHG